jgi:serine/threonine-protein kinase
MAAWALFPRGGAPGGQTGLDARDAGPGGDVRSRLAPRRGGGATPGAGDSLAAQAAYDSAAYDSAASDQPLTDVASGTVVPFVITRAESLAIAAAVSKRSGTQRADVDRAQLVAEVGRIIADSMSRAIKEMETAMQRAPQFVRPPEQAAVSGTATPSDVRRDGFDARTAPKATTFMAPLLAPPSNDRIRVVVTTFTNATGRREIGAIARDAATQLRNAVPSDRFDVVSADVTERATRSLPDKMSVGWALRADFVVSGWLIARGDSLSMVTMLTDVRTGRFQRATESVTAADVASTKPAVEIARKQIGAWLDTAATIAARRRAADTSRR